MKTAARFASREAVAQRSHELGPLDRKESVVPRVAPERGSEALGDHGLDPRRRQRGHRLLAARSDPEARAGDEDVTGSHAARESGIDRAEERARQLVPSKRRRRRRASAGQRASESIPSLKNTTSRPVMSASSAVRSAPLRFGARGGVHGDAALRSAASPPAPGRRCSLPRPMRRRRRGWRDSSAPRASPCGP